MKLYLRTLIGTLAVLSFFACSSAGTETALQKVFGTNTKAASPVFLSCKADSPSAITFRFSLPVTLVSAHFEPALEIVSVTNGDAITFTLGTEERGGELISADVLVEDEHKNTLNVLLQFRSRNDRLPDFLITELRTEASKPKGEFVELNMLGDGNLGALRLFAATNDEPLFEFPPVEVKKGEYVVIHLRTYEEAMVDETGSSLSASQGTEALATARDFWIPESKERLRKTDAVYLMDQDDRIIDAVLFTETPGSWGKNSGALEKAAELFGEQGVWLAQNGAVPAPEDAVSSTATTATRSISRDESRKDDNTAADWYITATSGATPGKANSTKRYVPK
jgi:hypothetical protein